MYSDQAAGRRAVRATEMPKRSMSKPVKLITSPSWLCFVSPKNMNFSVNPVSAANIVIEKMMIPSRACHGAIFALLELLAFGNMNVKKEKIHCTYNIIQFRNISTLDQLLKSVLSHLCLQIRRYIFIHAHL